MLFTSSVVKVSEVLTWPQALVGTISLMVVLGLPQILTFLTNRSVKRQVNNNGGTSMKDAVDRTEKKIDQLTSGVSEHVKDSAEEKAKLSDRLVRVETILEFALPKKDDSGDHPYNPGVSPGPR